MHRRSGQTVLRLRAPSFGSGDCGRHIIPSDGGTSLQKYHSQQKHLYYSVAAMREEGISHNTSPDRHGHQLLPTSQNPTITQ
jgi:hypothetical protein